MAFAGLWESWKDPNQTVPLETFCVLTTDPNELMQSIHSRVPVTVPRESRKSSLLSISSR
nr:SOS response-associated peptidase [Edaphobacter lichenicola]